MLTDKYMYMYTKMLHTREGYVCMLYELYSLRVTIDVQYTEVCVHAYWQISH